MNNKLNIIESSGYFIVKTADKYSRLPQEVFVDGKKISPNGVSEIVLNEKPKKIWCVSKHQVLDYMLVDGVKMSNDEYNTLWASFGVKYDEDGDMIFDSLDQEFTIRKFLETAKTIYRTEENEYEFDLAFFKSIKSEYPEITPLWSCGEEGVESDLCHYYPTPFKYLQDAVSKYGKTLEVENGFFTNGTSNGFSLPEHSKVSLQFLKYNREYVRSTPWGSNKNHFSPLKYQKYQDCVDRRAEYIKTIEDVVRTVVKLEEQKELSKTKAEEVFRELGVILTTLNKVDSKQSTRHSLAAAKTRVAELQKKLVD